MIDFLLDILRFNSTSGSENELAKYIFEKYKPENSVSELHTSSEGRFNVFFKYGEPKIIFCSHLDTVPPFIPPRKDGEIIFGRGTCDAKGQIAFLFETFKQLHSEGYNNIGMLMLSGEEDGSQGAIQANKFIKGCDLLFIGEPTENKIIKASKGNLLIKAVFRGKSCHSGYPEQGDSAFERMLGFFEHLKYINFPDDEILGKTTFNTSEISTTNAPNVIPDYAECKILFRTTFACHKLVDRILNDIKDDKTSLEFIYGDEPMKFYTPVGFETEIVSYGTDAPAFTNMKNKILYGPGSILDAHTDNEKIKIKDLHKAVQDIKLIYNKSVNEN